MKKALISISLTLICYLGYGQTTYPITQNLGSASTLIKNPNYGGFQGGIIPYTFADTTAANTALTYGKNYNGFEIYTQTPQAKWWRLADSSKWIMILPQGGGTTLTGQAWINPGNYNLFTDAKLNGGFGTLARNGIYIKTNGTTRLYLDKDGIAAATATSVGIGIDPSDSNRVTFLTASTPSWSLTGNSGTTAGTNFIGTTDAQGLYFKTNAATRLIIPSTGIASSTASTDSVLVTKTDGVTLGKIAKSALLSDAWLLSSGGTLTGANTILLGTNQLQFYSATDKLLIKTLPFEVQSPTTNNTRLIIDDVSSGISSPSTLKNVTVYDDSITLKGSVSSPTSTRDLMAVLDTLTGKVGHRAIPTSSGGTVTGSGTTNYVPKWSSSTALGNSVVYDDGTNIGIGTTSPTNKLHVVGNILATGSLAIQAGGSDTILFAVGGDTYIGGGYNTQNHGHFNETYFKYTNAGSTEDYFVVDASGYIRSSFNGGKILNLDVGAKQYSIGDIDGIINGNLFTVYDQDNSAYYDNTAHTGKFGINTSSPTVALDVVGDTKLTSSATTTTGLDVSSSTITSGALATFTNTGTAAASNTKKVLSIVSNGANATSTQTVTGAEISVTNTGTTATNTGLRVTASGGTNNYAIQATGNILSTASTAASVAFGVNGVGNGLFAPGGNSVGLAIGGTQRMYMDAGNTQFVSGVTTGSNTTAGLAVTANSLTTGNAFDVRSSSATSGNLAAIVSTSTAAASNTLNGLKVDMSGANVTASQTVTGQTISVTNTGTTNTNVGASFSASGATNNYGLLVPSGNVGIGVNPSSQLHLNGYNSSFYTLRTGDFIFQPLSADNGFISNNGYYNGADFKAINTGYGAGFQFFNGQLLSFGMASVAGGATQTKNTNFKSDYNGYVALGGTGISSVLGTYTGATVVVTPTAVGIGTTSPTAAGLQIAKNGAASVSGVLSEGTWFTGGTATTTKPQLLIEPTGTTSTAWSTSGTGLGINAASGFVGNLIDAQLNGASNFKVNASGGGTFASSVTASNAGLIISNTGGNGLRVTNGGFLIFQSDGVAKLSDNSDASWGRLQLGGTTTSFPAIARNGTGIDIKLADNSAFSTLTAARSLSKQGADVASVAGAISLGSDGTSFEITGTNAITLISNTVWANGSEVTLLFTSTATLTDGTANSGTDIGMELAGNVNFVASAGATITIILSEIGGTQRWREKARSVN